MIGGIAGVVLASVLQVTAQHGTLTAAAQECPSIQEAFIANYDLFHGKESYSEHYNGFFIKFYGDDSWPGNWRHGKFKAFSLYSNKWDDNPIAIAYMEDGFMKFMRVKKDHTLSLKTGKIKEYHGVNPQECILSAGKDNVWMVNAAIRKIRERK